MLFFILFVGASNDDQETCPEFLKRYADYLKCKYRRLRIVPDEGWRCSLCRYETRVALFEHDSEPNSWSDVPGNVILSKIDRITRVKKCIEIPEIFSPRSEVPNDDLKILIDGAPGIGKTTLTRKFCKDWAEGKLLENYRLVVLLSLREKRVFSAKSIDDLFYHDDPKLREQVVSYIRETQGDKVMLIFDGFDELSAVKRNEESLFLEIIRGEKLQNCSVVVTSRPYASTHLQWLSCISRHIEVLGFTEEHIKNYITSNIEDKSKATDLVQALQGRRDILSLCYAPLNCAIVVFIYCCEGYVLPETLTELYQMFLVNMIKRHMEKLKMSVHVAGIRDLDKLPGDLQACLNGLSSLAYKGTLQEKSTFSLEELQSELPNSTNSLASDTHSNLLSLMTSYQSVTGYGAEENYQFVHLTIQEFLAARHASRLPVQDQILFFRDPDWLNSHQKMMMFNLFLAGISKLSNPEYRDQCFNNFLLCFNDSLPHEYNSGVANGLLQFLHYFYEAQNSELCRVFSQRIEERVIRMSGIILHPFHCKILAYFLVHSGCRWKCLDLHQCGLNDFCLQVFQTVVSSGTDCGCIQELILNDSSPAGVNCFHGMHQNRFTLAGIFMISDTSLFNCTKVLKVSCYSLVPESSPLASSGFLRILQMEHLTELYFCEKPSFLTEELHFFKRTTKFNDYILNCSPCKLLEMPPQISNSLRTLSLVACEQSILFVVNALKASYITELELSFVENYDSASQQPPITFVTTFPQLQLLKTLQSLTLHLKRKAPALGRYCYCQAESELLQDLLESMQTLQTLVLQSDYMSDIDIQCISKGILANRSLKSLDIQAGYQPFTGFCPLFKALQSKETIESLHLFPDPFSGEELPSYDLTCLSRAIQVNKQLRFLYVSHIPIFGIRQITAGLTGHPSLTGFLLHSVVMPVGLGAQLLQVLQLCPTIRSVQLRNIQLVVTTSEHPTDQDQAAAFGQSAYMLLLEKEVTLDFFSVLFNLTVFIRPIDPWILPNPRPMIERILDGIANKYHFLLFHTKMARLVLQTGIIAALFEFEAITTNCDCLEEVASVSRIMAQEIAEQAALPTEDELPLEPAGKLLPISWDSIDSAVNFEAIKAYLESRQEGEICNHTVYFGVKLNIGKNQIRWIHKVEEGECWNSCSVGESHEVIPEVDIG